MRDGVAVWGSDAVQCAIITTGPPVSRSFLRHHVQGGRPGARGGAYNPQLQHVLKLLSGDLQPFWCQASGAGEGWRTCGLNVVRDIVFDSRVGRTHLRDGWEVREKFEIGGIGVLWCDVRARGRVLRGNSMDTEECR